MLDFIHFIVSYHFQSFRTDDVHDGEITVSHTVHTFSKGCCLLACLLTELYHLRYSIKLRRCLRMENESKSAYRAWPNNGSSFAVVAVALVNFSLPSDIILQVFAYFVITLQFLPTCLFVQGNVAQLTIDGRCFSQDRAFVLFAIKRSSTGLCCFFLWISFDTAEHTHFVVWIHCCMPSSSKLAFHT